MEKINIPTSRLPELLGDKFLNLIIFPTEKCNFRCSYCYEDFKIGKMKRPVIDGIKKLITSRSHSLEILEISWFGGEPLLAVDVIQEISKHAQAISKKIPSMHYQANITTNGYFLSIDMFNLLIDSGITFFQITLDGDRDLHNKTANNECFDRIWSNLMGFKDSELNATIELRIHYSPETWKDLKFLIEKINNEFSNDPRFVVYFKSIEHYGSKNDSNIGLFDYDTSKNIKNFLESQLANKSMIYNVPYASAFICYAAKATSFGIRSTGQLVKCTVALNEERNNVGHIRPDGTLFLEEDKLRLWIQGLQSGDKKMLECPNSQMRDYKPTKFKSIPIVQIQDAWNTDVEKVLTEI